MKLNHFDSNIHNKIKNIIENIILKIEKTDKETAIVNENNKNWKYNTSKEYIYKNKKLLEKSKEPYTNEYLLSFSEDVITDDLLSLIKELYPNFNKVTVSGHFHYPNEGYMGWHSNWNNTGKRLYITYASEDKKSFFRYLKDGEIVTSYDNKGITIREFDIPKPPDYFWHCVGSECDRYSFGFKILNI